MRLSTQVTPPLLVPIQTIPLLSMHTAETRSSEREGTSFRCTYRCINFFVSGLNVTTPPLSVESQNIPDSSSASPVMRLKNSACAPSTDRKSRKQVNVFFSRLNKFNPPSYVPSHNRFF